MDSQQKNRAVRETVSRMKPKGARGMAAVKRLGRNYATGNFDKIAANAAKEYGSAEAGKRVAGKIYWNKVKNRAG